MNRIPGETIRVKCPFNRGSVYLHVYRDGDRIAHMSLSHQIQDDRPPDKRSVMAETLDRISEVMAEAIKLPETSKALPETRTQNP